MQIDKLWNKADNLKKECEKLFEQVQDPGQMGHYDKVANDLTICYYELNDMVATLRKRWNVTKANRKEKEGRITDEYRAEGLTITESKSKTMTAIREQIQKELEDEYFFEETFRKTSSIEKLRETVRSTLKFLREIK